MNIRCVGLPTVQARIQDQVEDELRRQSSKSVRSLPMIRPRSGNANCLRPVCMRQAGHLAQVDLVLGGSIERLADRLLIGWRMVDLTDDEADWFTVHDQSYNPERLETMIRASLREFYSTVQQGDRSGLESRKAQPIRIKHIE